MFMNVNSVWQEGCCEFSELGRRSPITQEDPNAPESTQKSKLWPDDQELI